MKKRCPELISQISDVSRFEDSLTAFLRENEGLLPLIAFCRVGSPSIEDWAEYDDFEYLRNGAELEGTCRVYFDESLHMGCRDIEFSEKTGGRLHFTINIESEMIEVTAADICERDPDNY